MNPRAGDHSIPQQRQSPEQEPHYGRPEPESRPSCAERKAQLDGLEQSSKHGPEQGRQHGPEQGRQHGPEQGRQHGPEQGRQHGLEQGRQQALTPAQRMTEIGIVQAGAPGLHQRARPFTLPAEAAEAHDVVQRIRAAMDRVATAHQFAKGMGMAAPQIGIDRAAAVVRTAAGELILLNPRVIHESAERDTRFEGCLSFFDVRGQADRPAHVEVEHHHPDGSVATTRFTGGLARHVQHEIDHLEGRLYTDRMPAGTAVIPLSEYQGTGQPWRDG